MIPIKHRDLEKLAQRHWEAVENYASKKGVRYNLRHFKDIIDKYFSKFDFEMIVKAKPSDLEELSAYWDIFIVKDDKIFQPFLTFYDYLSEEGKFFNSKNNVNLPYTSKVLVDSLNISVCPYCNRNFIKGTEDRRIDELDHFYPKSKYPFLAISFYNLIPSCKTCNQTFKGTEEISVNPYEMELNYNFKLKLKNVTFYHSKEGFYLDYSDLEKKLGKNFTVFELKKLYNTHKDQVLELIQKQIVYSDEYIDDLFSRYEGTLFKNREDVIRHISGNYVDEDNFHLRPLSKLTHDIAQELGLID